MISYFSVDSTIYIGNFEFYNTLSSNGKYYFPNGFVSLQDGSHLKYNFMATDHLGNTRAVTSIDYNGVHRVEQKNSYYAYGGIMDDVSEGADVQTHKYNGKELDRMHGLDWYDYHARQYDGIVGQFWSMDPLCEKYYHISPYVYCAGNPINCIDPDGRSPWKVFGKAAFKVTKQVAKSGGSALVKGSTYAAAFNDVVDDVKILKSDKATTGEKVMAVVSLCSEAISPVSIKDAKSIYKGAKKLTSRAARRQVMREQGIPTSQQPKSQSQNASGREYSYETPASYGKKETKSVQQQTMDRCHDEPHWEAGTAKKDEHGKVIMNPYGRPKIKNDKSKVEYK